MQIQATAIPRTTAPAARRLAPGAADSAPMVAALRSSFPVTYQGALRDYLVHPL